MKHKQIPAQKTLQIAYKETRTPKNVQEVSLAYNR